jgi:uncharacterized membrane protein (UPF0182 family)
VQNELDSNTTISPQLTLLSSGGSEVIKGNLLTVPVAGSMIYVEPLYVQASGGQAFPVLREFLAYSNGSAAYQPTLPSALDQVFGLNGLTPAGIQTGGSTPSKSGSQGGKPAVPPPTTGASLTLQQAIADAQAAEARAEADLRAGAFAAYGRDERALRQALDRVAAAAGTTRATPTPTARHSP